MTAALLLKVAHNLRLTDDTFSGTITYAGTVYPAAIGAFRIEQQLSPGGFTPMLVSEVQVEKTAGFTPKSGAAVTVTPATNPARNCVLNFVNDIQTHWVLTVQDVDQGA